MAERRVEVRWLDSLATVAARDWDALAGDDNPFVRHAFLHGLEATGCIDARMGWRPRHLTLWEDGALVAAAPAYVKFNSHGEFVFDHAWAHAYARYGANYFPKLLCAVPYSPVTGPRLLAPDAVLRRALLQAFAACCGPRGFSSAHVNFHPDAEDGDFDAGWLARTDIQYHWRNDAGWQTFDHFLTALDHKHRKNIRQERAKVARAGITFRIVHGDEASADDLASMHGFYVSTFDDYGNSPALTLEFFQHLAQTMPRSLVVVLAELDSRPVAGALCLRGANTLYGRYWGAKGQHPGLHFEACYYQGIEYCLREGLACFEPGAQGEHKIARGFLPTLVRSRHWIADAAFRDALGDWCSQERQAVESHANTLAARSPFRRGEA